ncbi:MAG: DNA cytosine methyltransferase, partial [Candidatus Rokubacteria bacterium]|nr:DNA cytosine methyltransferase [Candidatus Rokubacteria bacterium]
MGHGIRGEDRAEWPGAPGIDRAAVESAERAHWQRRLGTVDLLVAGFPCQGASVAGKRRGLKDDRTALFWEIIRVGKALRPPFLLLE